MKFEKKGQLYEGKAKKVWATDNDDVVLVDYKDDATAFNGLKKGTIVGKGVVNNRMINGQGSKTVLLRQVSELR